MLRKAIKKLIRNLIEKLNLITLIDEVRNESIFKKNTYLLTNNGGKIDVSANVYNLQNDKTKIVVGKNTNIMGTLYVFAYGGSINIGDYCYVGDLSRIWSGESITIGNNVLISHNVNIVDTTAHEIDATERMDRYKELISKGPWNEKGSIKTSPIVIEDNVWISFNATILKGVTIGQGAIVAANSVVTKNVPPYSLVAGNPAKLIKYLN